jgi:site-specific recombinase XerD
MKRTDVYSLGYEGIDVREYIRRLRAAGVSLVTIGKLLGHRRAETTARYAHISETAARAAANKFGNREFGNS